MLHLRSYLTRPEALRILGDTPLPREKPLALSPHTTLYPCECGHLWLLVIRFEPDFDGASEDAFRLLNVCLFTHLEAPHVPE